MSPRRKLATLLLLALGGVLAIALILAVVRPTCDEAAYDWAQPHRSLSEEVPLHVAVFLTDEGIALLLQPLLKRLQDPLQRALEAIPGGAMIGAVDPELVIEEVRLRRPATEELDGRQLHVWIQVALRSGTASGILGGNAPVAYAELDVPLELVIERSGATLQTAVSGASVLEAGVRGFGRAGRLGSPASVRAALERALRVPLELVHFDQLSRPDLGLRLVPVALHPERESLARLTLAIDGLTTRASGPLPAPRVLEAPISVGLTDASAAALVDHIFGHFAHRSPAEEPHRTRVMGAVATHHGLHLDLFRTRRTFPCTFLRVEVEMAFVQRPSGVAVVLASPRLLDASRPHVVSRLFQPSLSSLGRDVTALLNETLHVVPSLERLLGSVTLRVADVAVEPGRLYVHVALVQ